MHLPADLRALACSVAYLFVGQTELTVSFLTEAVRVLTSGGRERSLALGGSAAGSSGASDVEGVEAVLRELQTTLAEEMALSVAVIRQEEEKAAAAAAGATNVSFAATCNSSCTPWQDVCVVCMMYIITHQ